MRYRVKRYLTRICMINNQSKNDERAVIISHYTACKSYQIEKKVYNIM